MRRKALITTLFLAIALILPPAVRARTVHNFYCGNCHKATVSFTELGEDPLKKNVCVQCHTDGMGTTFLNSIQADRTPKGMFTTAEASRALAAVPADTGTSHLWARKGDVVPAAGAQAPTLYAAAFNGRYGISRGKLTCTRCHNPHGYDTTAESKKLLKVANTADAMCKDCHLPWNETTNSGLETHPMVADYQTRAAELNDAAAAANKELRFKTTPTFAGSMQLVNGVAVSCSTCHAPHFVDSDSATPDGRDNRPVLGAGDGHLLRADGPSRTDKSALCQSCHLYMSHGNPTSPTYVEVGCMVCHSGHSFNDDGPNPNYFVLRRDKVNPMDASPVPDQDYTALGTLLNDMDDLTSTGFCERCHGPAQDIINHGPPGSTRYSRDCRDCHSHNPSSANFSWQWKATVEECGACHGFPPYVNQRGDKLTGGTDGGYAYTADVHNYNYAGYLKNEATTPHNSHAAGGLPQGAATDYILGTGQGACDPCHAGLANHRQDELAATYNATTFRDVAFGAVAKGNKLYTIDLNATYTTTGNGSCTIVYCHSNGGKRTGDANKTSTNFTFSATAPVWDGGDADIIGTVGECYVCHGNNATNMASGQRNNSASHLKHVAKYACNVCHVQTATSATALTASSRIAPNGTHVNGKPDIAFDTAYDLDTVAAGTQALTFNPVGDNSSGYTSSSGTCAVYCHSNGGSTWSPLTYQAPDWDAGGSVVCGSCHGAKVGDATVIASGSHTRHVSDANGPTLACNECHVNAGSYTVAGGHADHINAAVNIDYARCTACHAVDGGETTPHWGQPTTMDCRTCHSGSAKSTFESKTAPDKTTALTVGHNASVAYASGNQAANRLCTDCHSTAQAGHFDGISNDDKLLSATGSSCLNCHGSPGTAYTTKKGIVTHVGKTCTACHDPHGDATQANIYMVRSVSSGNFASDVTPVVFSSLTRTGAESYDEDDGAAGDPDENNADDLCATCHTYGVSGSITGHNNKDNQPTTATSHHQGENCMTGGCHKPHTDTGGAFLKGGGTKCDDCHGNPPTALDPRYGSYGTAFGAHAKHFFKSTEYPAEDRTDCEICHPGAGSYALGHSNGGGAVSLDARITVLGSGNYSCGTLNSALGCHQSDSNDGFWKDTTDYAGNGLRCTSCHNNGTNDGVLANAAPATGAHTKHITASKTCTDCHNGGFAITDTSHITNHGVVATTDDGVVLADRAKADLGEGTVANTGGTMTYDQATLYTCTGGIGLGCHNSKTGPDWRTFTGITCTTCHTAGGADAGDPTSGLHYGTMTVSGNTHDNSFSDGNGGTATCVTCHTASPSSAHFSGAVNNSYPTISIAANMGFTDGTTPTCGPNATLVNCHSDNGTWARKWSGTARDVSGSALCANCHGTFAAGWNSGVIHTENASRGDGHSNVGNLSYPCTDCHVIGATNNAYLFTLGSNDWQVVEAGTTKHGDGFLQLNSNTTGFTDAGARAGCATVSCHGNDSTHDFLKSTLFTTANTKLVTLSGDVPPVTCYNCHGGATVGVNQNNYWPDKGNTFEGGGNLSEDNGGRHQIHMERLAKAVYNETITGAADNDILKNSTTFNPGLTSAFKQQALCDYCHEGASNHGDKINLPAQVTTMYYLWLPKTADGNASWVPSGGDGNCSNINCHNGKATSVTTDFTWYGIGTQNCLLCHNDITDTTAGTTGATHQAHVGAAAAIFGKAMNCASCHGGSVTWSPYAVPSSNHINGQFRVAGGTVIDGTTYSYSGTYTDVATRSVGDCATNLCHNDGKNGAPYKNGGANYNWQTAFAGCTACHRTDSNLASSHDPHLNASFASTFRSTALGCTDCHDAVSASDMTGKTGHMDGTVSWKSGAAFSYTGNVSVATLASYGTCSGACHVDHLGAGKASPTWNRTATPTDNCTICHASPPADGRHAKHMAETDYVTGCGNCHTSATATTITSATHFNGIRNTAGTASVVYTAGDGTCTNSCHVVVDGRDWTSGGTSPVLACTDCHQAGTIAAGKGALPTSGLHNMTATGVQKHDATLGANGCKECHVTPAGTHLDNNFVPDGINNNDRFLNTRSGLSWVDGATNSGTCFDNGASGAGSLDFAVGCHRDNGAWKRLWSTDANVDSTANPDPGQLVCDVCHGQYQTLHASSKGWREGSVHYRSGGSAGENKGVTHNRGGGNANACEDCHAYDSSGGANHQNGVLNFSGGAGVPGTYTLTMGTSGWYCATCHDADSADVATDTASHTFPDSTAFASRAYVVGATQPEGGCTTCHGNATSGNMWPDGSTAHAANQDGGHTAHVLEIAKKKFAKPNPTVAEQNTTCDYCHPGNTHGGVDASLPADVSRTDLNNDGSISGADPEQGTYMKKIVGGGPDNDPVKSGFWRRTPGTCSNVACHASAPFTPHWYGDTVAPGAVTLTVAAGPVPRSIRLSWTAVGDDGTLDGTAYKYDIRMSPTSSAIATDFSRTDNYVQGVPTVKRKGEPQEVIIHNVNPSTTYYFSLRTYDENVITDPNTTVYGTSNTASYLTPVAGVLDSTPPVLTGSPQWYGVDSAKALDTSGTVKLAWARAEDHSMPITYDIYYDTGSIDYGGDDNVLSTKDTSFRVTGLTDNQTYNFAVRAKDAFGNTDTNTATLQAIPQGLSEVPKTGQVYYANGAISGSNVTVNTTVYTATGSSTLTTGIYFIVNSGAAYAAKTNVYADTFAVYVSNANASNTMTAELGYYDTAFRSFTATNPAQTALTKSATLAARAKKVVPFKFGEMRWVPAGARLAVKLTQTQAGTVNWGSATNRGDLTTQLQPVNTAPTTPTITTLPVSGANVSFYWAQSTDDADGVADTVHYDVYGDDGTGNFSYVIATGLTTNATSGSPLVWDTQAAGIALTGAVTNVQVKVEAGDSMNGKTFSHTPHTSGNLTVNNSGDNVPPGTITHFKAETRPKQGSVYLTWTAPGDDGDNNGRASSYDIRWATAVIDNDTKYNAATQLVSEPYPDFGGNGQGYEVLGLADGNYYFAIKAVDKGNKTSPLAYTTATSAAGPKCGICHSTPPDEDATKGNHAKHGFTIAECANCHGTEAATFTTDHQDGAIKLGWKTATPATATIAGQTVTYYQDPDGGGPLPALKIYEDTSGSGGFNPTGGDATDNGSCFNWSSQNISGCHGPAAEASWDAAATLVCSACHGDNDRILDMWGHSFDDPGSDVKSAPPVDNHGYDGSGATPAERKYVGAHVAHLNYSFRLSKGDSCRLCHGASRPGVSTHADGIIDVKLDLNAAGATAQWTEGTPTTAGTCSSMSPDSCHPSTATPKWDSNETFACTNCHGMGGTTPSHVTDTAGGVSAPDNGTPTEQMPGNCTWCHVGGHPKEKKVTAITKASPAVVTTEHNHNLATNDKVTIHTQTGMTEINNKTYAVTVIDATRFSLQGSSTTTYGTFDYGTWIEGNGYGVILVPNDSRVGIAYQSGGVHLKANVGARGEMQSEAELCWSCHAPNNISEWGADSAPANATGYQSGNGNNYNFGQIYLNAAGGTVTSNWLGDGGGAFWRSGYTPGFNYKDGRIRSTHSTAPTGSSQLINGVPYNYGNTANSERLDPVNIIRCSNCHDVHNLNKAPEDNPNNLAALNGPPYLRGTWRSNPYKEDGAPQQGTAYTAVGTSGQPGYGYGAVPRASNSTTMQMGGFWIDQNSGNPTAGWSYETSAGLCQRCHGASVDALNYDPSGAENLWLSSNGHANSVLGGSGTGAANIFKNGITSNVGRQGTGLYNTGPWMAFQGVAGGSGTYGYSYRSSRTGSVTNPLQPYTAQKETDGIVFAWGATVDNTSPAEIGYHQFSCSKCHNPHASRLPKLMITNCLDVARNTWDNSYDATQQATNWNTWRSATISWNTNRISHTSAAQNCHRFVDVNGDNTPDESGWNKVTPW